MTTRLDLATATRLLQQLADDDNFREQMLGDPVGAMSSLGVNIEAASVPAVRRLPDPEFIRANLSALAEGLEGKEGMDLFFLA